MLYPKLGRRLRSEENLFNLRSHFYILTFMEVGQNVCMNDKYYDFETGASEIKIRSPAQIKWTYGKLCVLPS